MPEIIKVAQIIGKGSDGGVESFLMNYYKNIDRSKIQFHFYIQNVSKLINPNKIEQMGGKVFIIPKYFHFIKYIKFLKHNFLKEHYDIVHANLNSLSFIPLYAAKKAGVNVRIAHSHSTTSVKEGINYFIKLLLRPFSKMFATHYFACSEDAGKWLFGKKTFYDGRITIISDAIEIKKFEFNQNVRQEVRNDLNFNNDNFIIGHVGRFVKQKNHEFLIDIFKDIKNINKNAKLLLVGEGPLEKKILDKVKKIGLVDDVIFVGNHKHVERFYQAMDIFVFPSLYEGLGMCLVEAQCAGLTCVASTNIPKDVVITNRIKFISLKEKSNIWAKKIISMKWYSINYDRKDVYYIDKHDYDIITQAKLLYKIYLSMLEHK